MSSITRTWCSLHDMFLRLYTETMGWIQVPQQITLSNVHIMEVKKCCFYGIVPRQTEWVIDLSEFPWRMQCRIARPVGAKYAARRRDNGNFCSRVSLHELDQNYSRPKKRKRCCTLSKSGLMLGRLRIKFSIDRRVCTRRQVVSNKRAATSERCLYISSLLHWIFLNALWSSIGSNWMSCRGLASGTTWYNSSLHMHRIMRVYVLPDHYSTNWMVCLCR